MSYRSIIINLGKEIIYDIFHIFIYVIFFIYRKDITDFDV